MSRQDNIALDGMKAIRLNRTRANFIAQHWNHELIAFEIGSMRAKLEAMLKDWDSSHPNAAGSDARNKVVSNLKKMDELFLSKDFWLEMAKPQSYYGERFAKFEYISSLKNLWPLED